MNDTCIEESIQTFGIRTVKLVRTADETTYYLNGKKLYIRGTAYFPDVYVSNLHEARYRRDLELIKNAGFNAVRVHVHTPRPAFFDICDELGLAVLQDFDINWKHVEDENWGNSKVEIFGDLVREYRNHACIITWVCTNEPSGGIQGYLLTTSPGPQLVAEAKRLDPDRPTIKGSGAWGDDPENGDTHNYIGSLDGGRTHYTDMYERLGNKWNFIEKLNTEFGFDAPGCKENLRTVPQVYKRLKQVIEEGIDEIQYYQYRLLKYYIEHYRVHKYEPNSGYFQFMFIDLCPQSFYGVYDWWGMPKEGLKALQESNNPISILMYYKDKPGSVWVVNDLLEAYPEAVVEWLVTDDKGTAVDSGSKNVNITEDSRIKITDLSFEVDDGRNYKVCLYLKDSRGRILARNIYNDAFHHPAHPKGHPERMSHETGMRLYWV
jgi:beta-mannosidase